jgi:hydroxyacylglutathione hydrolase
VLQTVFHQHTGTDSAALQRWQNAQAKLNRVITKPVGNHLVEMLTLPIQKILPGNTTEPAPPGVTWPGACYTRFMQIDHPQVLRLAAFNDNYIWLIHQHGLAAVVDPGDAQVVEDALEKHSLRLAAILITHHHADHVGGLLALKTRHQVTVYGPPDEGIQGIDVALQAGHRHTLAALDWSFVVMRVPGHTAGHVALAGDPLGSVPEPVLFCGDTLFAAGCGRLFEGTPAQMFDSLQRLGELPQSTLVYCAHEYTQGNLIFAHAALPGHEAIEERLGEVIEARSQGLATIPSTIALERATNPFLLARNVEQFALLRRAKDSYRPGASLEPIALTA